MINLRSLGLGLILFTTALSLQADTNKIEALTLKPFVGKSQFDRLNVPWLLPLGDHVADGVPFRIDGIIELYGKSALQQELDIRTNVTGIPVGRALEELHLLCATTGGSPTKDVPVAQVHLRYADGSSNSVPILFGRHIRQWWGPRHEEDSPLADPRAIPAWSMEMSDAARSDKRSRFFHSILENPSPEKVVTSLDLESAKSVAGLMLAGMAVGPKNAAKLPDTLPNIPPDKDDAVRKGEPRSIEGRVATLDATPLAGVVVRIVGVRGLKEADSATSIEHPTVGNETRTDTNGGFELEQLPDDRLYRLLVVSDQFAPYIFYGADTLRGAIEMRLRPQAPLQASKKFFVHGQVVDESGKPIIGATVSPDGVSTDASTRWGSNPGFSDTITSGTGEFLMERDEPFTRLQLKIFSPGFAPERLWLSPGNGIQKVEMGPGASIMGRVVQDDKPLANVKVSVSGKERSSEVYAGSYSTVTDSDGRFHLRHLPPHKSWFLYGDIDSFKEHGALPSRIINTGPHRNTNTVGDLKVVPGITLAGRVETVDGGALPAKLQLYLSMEDLGHGTTIAIAPDGSFKFTGLYKGVISIYPASSEWQLAPVNRSLDEYNSWRLIGPLETNKTDLLLVVEKKRREYNGHSFNGHLPTEDQSRSRPLFGAEASGPAWLTFAGTIVDEDSGKMITNASITPGRKPPVAAKPAKPLAARLLESFREQNLAWNERIFWEHGRTTRTTNGQFLVKLVPLGSSTPLLRIEADGYEPIDTEPLTNSVKNLVIKLSHGTGPRGIVLQPDGKPAVGANVVYGQEGQQYSMGKSFELTTYGNTNVLQVVGADGRFSFHATKGGRRLFMSHSNGWANIPVNRISPDDTITLQPWAAVTGTLVTKNGTPAPDMLLALTMWKGKVGGDPFVNLNERPKTDAAGRFTFTRVPFGELELKRLVPAGVGSGMSYVNQTPVYAAPGKTNDLGNVTLDTPPPPTVLEELKKKIGL